jgi:hypothetical protein
MSAGLSVMYQNLLGRTPSQDELAGWQGTGLSGQALYDAFQGAAQQELASRPAPSMGNLNNYVNANYQQLLGRAPSEQERTAWMGSGLSPEQLYQQMSQAAQTEQQARGFTPTTPTAPTQSPGLTDFISTPMNQGGLGGLGGTNTGGGGANPGNAPGANDMLLRGQAPDMAALMNMFSQSQQTQQQSWQDMMNQQSQMFGNMTQQWGNAFQNAFQPNTPTFGPGSGGNFGGQTSPVYRPGGNAANEGPRNGWGGPWQSNNPFSPTF